MGERTQRLTAKVVGYHELEPLELKGKAERVAAWEAVSVGSIEEAAGPALRSSAPLIGRDEELGRLQGLLDRVAREHAPAPGHDRRPGRGRQVAPAGGARRDPRR